VLPVAVRYGLFVEDADAVHTFVDAVVAELGRQTTLEFAQVRHLAGVYLRPGRIAEL
jgi:hypothetical protein